MTQKEIKDDLLEQLRRRGMYQSYYLDLVNDYMTYYKMKNDLKKDIKEKGFHITVRTGNGHMATKENGAYKQIQSITVTMLKILDNLGLKTPIAEDDEDDYI